MTNLTSEQYRDVIKNIPNCTEEIPTVQHLLRRAVQTFFKRFRGYPELAGVAPGKIGIFGEQTQFSDGLALPVATPMATIVVGRKVGGTRFTVVTSEDVGKPHKVTFSFSSNRPLGPGCPVWLNYVKGVIDNFDGEVPPFEAAIESSIPMGSGFGSSSAVEVATYTFLEVLTGKKSDPIEKFNALKNAEKEFIEKEVGPVDRITSILAKDRHAMLIDCKTNEVEWIPFHNTAVTLIAVNTHLKDTVFGDEYPERSKYLSKACQILGVESLRNCSEDDLMELENRVNEIMSENQEDQNEEEEGEKSEEGQSEEEVWTNEDYKIMLKRARFYITEMRRIKEAIEAWNEGDVETFGERMNESHEALKEDFDFNNPVLDFLVENSLQVEGVLGSRMTGMGLGYGGGIVSLINKENIEQYCNYLTEKFEENEAQLTQDLKESRQEQKQKRYDAKNKLQTRNNNPDIGSADKVGDESDPKKTPPKRLPLELLNRLLMEGNFCIEKKKIPCIRKVLKPRGKCWTWDHYQKEPEVFPGKKVSEEEENVFPGKKVSGEEENVFPEKKVSIEEETASEENFSAQLSQVSEVSEIQLKTPSFYIISPFAGARMMFITKSDILRSLYSKPLPQPKILVQNAIKIFEESYGNKIEAVGLAPATISLFGEFMEYHLGYIITMSLPMYLVTVGGRNDTVLFSVKTTSEEVDKPTEMTFPVPCIRQLEMESRDWVNFVKGVVNEFKSHIPGFNAVIHSSIPIRTGVNSCAGLQASFYTFLENLTGEYLKDPLQKAERCSKSEFEFKPTPTELVDCCSNIKFLSAFLSKEGHLMLIDCHKYKVTHYFFDDPSYIFLIAICKKNTTNVTPESLEDRLKKCMEAIDILEKTSLLYLDLKHVNCLKKRDAPEDVIKRAKYVITEHQRTVEAVKAIRQDDYERVGLLMNQSHASLRDDYEISSPEIENLIELAMSCEGVLGAKMLGKGFKASIIILIEISHADKCIRYMRKNYKNKTDKPVFYITKPSEGAFAMCPTTDIPNIP